MKSIKTLTLLLFLLLANINLVGAAKPLDFDGDGKSDFGVIRLRPAGSFSVIDWFVSKSSDNTLLHCQWGLADAVGNSDTLTPADFDGDGKTDFAIWRPQTLPGAFTHYILRSSDSTVVFFPFGAAEDNILMFGDYDGDGKADPIVYRSSTSLVGNNYIYRGSLNNPNGNLTYVRWGFGLTVIPIKGDFDGDGKLDFCIRTSTGQFILKRSSDSGVEYIQWGVGTDQVFPGDYDGDGKTDFCVLRIVNSEYQWFILERDGGGTGANPIIWGRQNLFDTPSAGPDYDGDGRSDIAVYRLFNPNNTFFVRKSGDGSMILFQWGSPGDGPILNF